MVYIYHASLAVLVRFSPHGAHGVLLTAVLHLGSKRLITSWHSMGAASAVSVWNIGAHQDDENEKKSKASGDVDNHPKLVLSKAADLLDISLAKSNGPVTVLHAVAEAVLLIGGNMDGDIYFWDTRRCRLLAISEKLHSSPVRAIEYLTRSQDLIVGYEDGCKS